MCAISVENDLDDAARTKSVQERILDYAHLYGLDGAPNPEPRSRYFLNRGAHQRFCWTTQPVDGHFFSWIYVPTEDEWVDGKPTLFDRTREVKHSTRRVAKARALRLARQAAGQQTAAN
jgi:hypothetical protein